MLRQGRSLAIRAAWLVLLAGPCPSALALPSPGKPAYLWLWYADGKAIPEDGPYCTDLADPPAYKCNFGTDLRDCQQQVQAHLDNWYTDFNLVFTLTRPQSGEYNTVVITSGWPQCATEAADLTGGSASNEGGIAPGICAYNTLQTGIAIACGSNALDCATVIAHEHGHMLGLVHTTNQTDVMYPAVQSLAKGFVNEDMKTVQDLFNTCSLGTQNTYKTMLATLGPWPGGAKPGLVYLTPDGGVDDAAARDATMNDAGAPDAAPPYGVDGPSIGTVIGPVSGSTVDGSLTVSSGFDAIARTPPIIPDAGPAKASPSSSGGCDLAGSRRSPSLLFAAGALLVCLLLSRRAALSRSAVRARTTRSS